MSSKSENQRRVYEFLKDYCATQKPFTLQEFQTASGFSASSFSTYLGKQFRPLLVPCGGNFFRVHLGFRKFSSWERFQQDVVSQNRVLVRNFRERCHNSLLLYEFFMPLRNEEWLRSALDSLFFKDAIMARLNAMNDGDLEKNFPSENNAQNDPLFREGICSWISKRFVGYSISHVSGRFKVGPLRTRKDVAEAEASGSCRYLVDETTAIVRFIFPCDSHLAPQDTEKFANQVSWIFDQLFVKSILEVVNGEDEVWLLESGLRNRLRRFEVED